MASFAKALNITILTNEGGYNPGTDEKETYKGIDRGANPGWAGWPVIDAVKNKKPGLSSSQMNVILSQNTALQQNIAQFYKANYWEVINLDNVTDQQLANNLFDCAVNQGEGLARKFMQVAVNNVISAIRSPMKPIIIDRKIGPATLNAFNTLPPDLLNVEINVRRRASYRADHGFAQWGRVWEKRLLKYT